MRILLFGKSGQVATELQKQADVTALSRGDADLANAEACTQIIRSCDADVIINAAAYTAVDKAEKEEPLATLVNGIAPREMAKAAALRNIPFLHISTDYVFDGSGDKPWRPNDTPAPIGAYGRTKLLGERGVQAAAGDYAILRTSWVFSAHGANFVKTMLRLGKTTRGLRIVNDQTGGPTAAADIATTLLTIAKAFHDGTGKSGIYHYASAPSISWAGFAREIFKHANLNVDVTGIPTSAYPTPAARPLNSRMDCGSLATAFGINQPDWRQSLAKVLQDLGDK